jgi:hypothetical protein
VRHALDHLPAGIDAAEDNFGTQAFYHLPVVVGLRLPVFLIALDGVRVEVRNVVAERAGDVDGGILSIYLGYRLFVVANLPSESGAKIKAKLIEVTATKIGPDIFFASFGSYKPTDRA